jgi:enterochelin esterase family protein
VELPKAAPQPWRIPSAKVPKGSLTRETVVSRLLKEDRVVTVYTPAGYAQSTVPCRLLILFDGEDYQSLIPAPTILDNLIAGGKVAPTVALLVHAQGTRFRDLLCSASFAGFVATELVPSARARYRISAGPQNVTVGGVSLGGLMAGYCGLQYPEVFGNVLSQSGAFWHGAPGLTADASPMPEDGWLARQFAAASRRPLRLWLEVGRLESTGMVNNNRRLRDVLTAKGYDVIYSEFTGGHDYLSWRGSLADAFMALLGEPGGR